MKPQITLTGAPSKFSPVYGINQFTFTASFTGSTAKDAHLIADIQPLKQFLPEYSFGLTVSGMPSFGYDGDPIRYKTPLRVNNKFVMDLKSVIETRVTFPFDSGNIQDYDTIELGAYVNEQIGFGTPISNFPTISPEQDSMVRYRFRYGMEWNPSATFSQINAAFRSGETYSVLTINSPNMFVDIGDKITIRPNSGLYSYYDGKHTVIDTFTLSTNTYMVFDRKFNVLLGTISNSNIPGSIISAEKFYGTSSIYWGYNGTRQYDEIDVNFDNIYYMRATASTSPLFYSTSTASNFSFMNDFGKTSDTAIRIRQGQGERLRFLADWYDDTDVNTYKVEYYNNNLQLIGSYSTSLRINGFGGFFPGTWSYGAYTLQAFDKKGVLASNANTTGTPVVVGNYYKFSLRNSSKEIASIWYKGESACNTFDLSNIRIKFMNRAGSWSYFNFDKGRKQTITGTRTEVKTNSYERTFIQPKFGASNTDDQYSLSKLRGNNILNVKANETWVINTDWITEEEYLFLSQQLVYSQQVFIFYDTYTMKDNSVIECVNIPIVITDSSFEVKTTWRDKLFNLQLTFKTEDYNIQTG